MKSDTVREGNVSCVICGTYLGNYLTGDYYSLIRTKYCPVCKDQVRRQQKRVWQHDRRHCDKLTRKAEKDQLQLLKQENELLRERIRKLKEESGD